MIELIGKIVEIGAVDTIYVGKLIEVNEDEIHLESESGWIVIPMDRIAFIREKNNDN